MSSAPVVAFAPRAVDVAAIERELALFWKRPEGESDTQAPVTRACMSNLLIYCSHLDDADRVSSEIGHIVAAHPSRVLLLVGDAAGQQADIQAHVSAQCHLGGGGRQICSEHVAIHARSGAASRLASVARPLLIGDLPTTLLLGSAVPPPLAGELFDELSDMAGNIIYDSLGWPDPVRGIVATGDWTARRRKQHVVADLAWRRLKPWRRLVGQGLDPRVAPGALAALQEIEIEHGPNGLTQSWLLVGWLAHNLGWRPEGGSFAAGREVTWGFATPAGPARVKLIRLASGEPEVQSMTVRWATSTVTFARLEQGSQLGVTAIGEDAPYGVVRAPRVERERLVAAELPDRSRDHVFLHTLDIARTMAGALLR